MTTSELTRRGTSNSDTRGSSTTRRARRAWLLRTYESDRQGFCRCYRCGWLLFNPDDSHLSGLWGSVPMTIDRILPGCRGGTYRRENIRPACGPCNSETGGSLRSHS